MSYASTDYVLNHNPIATPCLTLVLVLLSIPICLTLDSNRGSALDSEPGLDLSRFRFQSFDVPALNVIRHCGIPKKLQASPAVGATTPTDYLRPRARRRRTRRPAMAARALLLACGLLAALQLSMACDNCIMHAGASTGLRRTMLRAHSAACMSESGATPEEAQALEAGPPPTPSRAQLQHLYCVLRRCNMIGADGRPRLAPELMAAHECRRDAGDAPEDEAWKLFFCGCGAGPARAAAPPTPAADVTPSADPEPPHTSLPNATGSLPTQ